MKYIGDMVYRLALSRTKHVQNAEDIFQEVFLKLSKKLPNFENSEHQKAWLIRVTINCSNNLLKSAWYNRNVELDENIHFETQERHDIYFDVLKLPKKDRTIIYLFYYEQLKLSEIADVLKISEANVKIRLHRARQKLKGGFENE